VSRSCPAKKPHRISKETNWVLISWVRSPRTGKYLVWAQQVPTERSEDIPNYNRSMRPHFDSWLSSHSTSFRCCLVAQCPKFLVHPCLRYLWIQYALPFFECFRSAVSSALHSAFPVLLFILYSMPDAFTVINWRFVLFFCPSKCHQMALDAQIMETYHMVRSLQNLTPPTISLLLIVCYKARK